MSWYDDPKIVFQSAVWFPSTAAISAFSSEGEGAIFRLMEHGLQAPSRFGSSPPQKQRHLGASTAANKLSVQEVTFTFEVLSHSQYDTVDHSATADNEGLDTNHCLHFRVYPKASNDATSSRRFGRLCLLCYSVIT